MSTSPRPARAKRLMRRLAVGSVCAACSVALATATAGAGAQRSGPLTGTWSGYIAGQPGSGLKREHITVVVNRAQSGGTWSLSATCHGPLTLDSISGGYHHYLRHRGHGVTCGAGDIDCLKRAGAAVFDSVTAHRGGEYDMSGTLRRVS